MLNMYDFPVPDPPYDDDGYEENLDALYDEVDWDAYDDSFWDE